MLDEGPSYDIEIYDADVVEDEVVPETTSVSTQDDERPSDHQVAVNTAQELIRQRGILMDDLEEALNVGRRYRGILKDNHLPDPCAARLEPLLQKYGMTGKHGGQPRQKYTDPKDLERIAALTVGLLKALPPDDQTKQLTSGS